MQKPLHCYLIDDDKDESEILLLALKERHPFIKIDVAMSGFEAIERLSSENFLPDIIFLDLNMPRMNGLECLKKIRQNKFSYQLPVIIYSTSGNQQDKERSLLAGATDYLVKPYNFILLQQSIEEIFRQYLERSFI
jgi:CheY-like chemotaxis protein